MSNSFLRAAGSQIAKCAFTIAQDSYRPWVLAAVCIYMNSLQKYHCNISDSTYRRSLTKCICILHAYCTHDSVGRNAIDTRAKNTRSIRPSSTRSTMTETFRTRSRFPTRIFEFTRDISAVGRTIHLIQRESRRLRFSASN